LLSSLDEKDHDYQRRRKFLLKFLDILKESKLLKEVKDVLDEIKIIESVLKDQAQTLKCVEPSQLYNDRPGGVCELIDRADQSIQKMKERAEAVEKGASHTTD
jgi:hypothetical protein